VYNFGGKAKEDLDVGGRIILKWILQRDDGAVWTGLIWLRIGISWCSLEHGTEHCASVKIWKLSSN
jgi:hypothetical protein